MDLMKLKALLGIPEGDTTQNIALQFLMEDVDETIRNYCNLKAVPASTSFTSAADALSGGILKDYQGQLNRYRKLGW